MSFPFPEVTGKSRNTHFSARNLSSLKIEVLLFQIPALNMDAQEEKYTKILLNRSTKATDARKAYFLTTVSYNRGGTLFL